MRYRFFLLASLIMMSIGISATEGALKGKFTVNADGKQVQFSQGNLQYNAGNGETHETATGTAKGTWRFATYQYDIIGSDNTNIAEDYNGYIDLFGWGTSGYNARNPWLNTANDKDYGNPDNDCKSDISGTYYDWGVFNAIYNGGDEPGIWRTLTADEWKYITKERENADKLISKFAIGSQKGIILLPDDWDLELIPLTVSMSEYRSIDVVSWAKWHASGAVFLPMAGSRDGNDFTATSLPYATSTYNSSYGNYRMNKTFDIDYSTSNYIGTVDFQIGLPVRLVKNAPHKVTVNTVGAGTVTAQETGIDLDAVEDGATIHLVATPAEGYIFDSWEGYDPETGLTVNSDVTVTAIFKQVFKVTITPTENGHIEYYTEDHTEVDLSAVPVGTVLFFNAIPDEGYVLDSWEGYDLETGLTVNSDATVTATFKQQTFPVTLRTQGITSDGRMSTRRMPQQTTAFLGGSIRAIYGSYYKSSPNTFDVPLNTELEVSSVASEGWVFDHYTVNDEEVSGDPITITITDETVITGFFRQAPLYDLLLQDDGNGVVTLFNDTPGDEIYSTETLNIYEGQEIILFAHPNIGYEFDHWEGYTAPYFDEDADDWIIPTMTGNTRVKAYFRKKESIATKAGALEGLFTIGEDEDGKPRRVQFSQGNLQYIAGDDGKTHQTADGTAQGTWQFAAEQTEYIASKNINAASYYNKPIDLFLYGASGYNDHYPWLFEQEIIEDDIEATNYDWGVYNAISNGGDKPGLWRTLIKDEWEYMLYQRGAGTNFIYNGRLLHGVGTADGEPGLFLMPDNWVMPAELVKQDIQFLPLESDDYATNKYKSDQWSLLQQSGVVFLPAAGARVLVEGVFTVMMSGEAGTYLTSTVAGGEEAYFICIYTASAGMGGGGEGGATIKRVPIANGGCSVRLVRDVLESEIPITTGLDAVANNAGAQSARPQDDDENVGANVGAHAQKLLLPNGEIRILHNGKQYNLLGTEVK